MSIKNDTKKNLITSIFYSTSGSEREKSLTANIWGEAGCNLDKFATGLNHIEKGPWINLLQLTCVPLDCGKKPKQDIG